MHGTWQILRWQTLRWTELKSFVLVTGSVTLYQPTSLVLLMLNGLQWPTQKDRLCTAQVPEESQHCRAWYLCYLPPGRIVTIACPVLGRKIKIFMGNNFFCNGKIRIWRPNCDRWFLFSLWLLVCVSVCVSMCLVSHRMCMEVRGQPAGDRI